MSDPERNTLELIHTAAKEEFMEKGFALRTFYYSM